MQDLMIFEHRICDKNFKKKQAGNWIFFLAGGGEGRGGEGGKR